MSRLLRAEMVLPLTIVLAATTLAASEFMTTFVFSSGPDIQEISTAADRHAYALLILAIVAIVATVLAVRTGLRSASLAAAIFGLAALLLFLLIDLPDAGKAGPLNDDPAVYFADARADPQSGFWLEAIGSVVLGLATVGFATLTSAQLRAPAELLGSGRSRQGSAGDGAERRRDPRPTPEPSGHPGAGAPSQPAKDATGRRAAGAVAARAAKREAPARQRGRAVDLEPADEREDSATKRSLPGWLRRPRSNGS